MYPHNIKIMYFFVIEIPFSVDFHLIGLKSGIKESTSVVTIETGVNFSRCF